MEATPQCRQAIEFARGAAERLGRGALSSAHLVFGLLAVQRGVAEVMKRDGLTVEVAEHFLESHPFRAEETMEMSGIVFGRSAVVAFERAEEKARKTNCRFISTDHVLLVICGEESGEAREMFDALKIDRAKLRQSVVERLSVPPPFDFSTLDIPE